MISYISYSYLCKEYLLFRSIRQRRHLNKNLITLQFININVKCSVAQCIKVSGRLRG